MCALVFQTRTQVGQSLEGGDPGIWIEHHMAGFVCCRCGNCCTGLGYDNDCTREDFLVWKAHDRQDILERVMTVAKPGQDPEYRIWMDPATGEISPACPWLMPNQDGQGFVCHIQEFKPEVCRQYPFTRKHARMTGCPGSFTAVSPKL